MVEAAKGAVPRGEVDNKLLEQLVQLKQHGEVLVTNLGLCNKGVLSQILKEAA